MNKILLIFLNSIKDINYYNYVVSDFEAQGYMLYLYKDISSDNFSYTDLPEIIRFYQNNSSSLHKIVVMSNIRDLTYFWYRCYNHLVDDFIYLVEEEEVNYFDIDDIYYSAYYNIFEFNKIETETIEGKIYLTKKCNTILPLFYEPKFFQLYKNFDFNRICNKLCINKTYELKDYIFDFNVFETNNREVITIDKISKRIVFFKGASSFDVLRIITDYYIEFFDKLGFEIDIVDFKNNDDLCRLNEKLIHKKSIFIYSANCIRNDLQASDDRNLFDAIDTPFLGTLGDHPVNQYSRISNGPKKSLFTCLDSENILYLKKYFPDKKIITNYALGFKSNTYTEQSFFNREIDLIFIGTLQEPDSIFDSLKTYDPILITIIKNVCDKILQSNKMLNIDAEIEEYVCQYNLTEYVRVFLHSTIERYIRIYKRYHLVKQLGKSGLNVVCIGNKEIYNKLNVSGKLIIYDNIGFQEMLALFNNCKLLINMTGHLFNGVTERVLSAMLNGAAVATERDLFTSSNFKHKENIILYDFNRLDLLINDIRTYLNDIKRLEELALSGQLAARYFDYRTGAVKFPRIIRNFDENFNKEISSRKIFLPDINQYKKYINVIYDNRSLIKNGQIVKTLENRLAEYLGVKNLLLVSNTAIAMQILIRLLKLKGEVITSPFNLDTIEYNLIWNNLYPVYVDIDDETLNIDPDKIENKITDKTSFILSNHLFGYSCDIDRIIEVALKYNLKTIFDATHAFDVLYKEKSILNQGDISFVILEETQYFHSIEGMMLIINNDNLYKEAQYLVNNDMSKTNSHYSNYCIYAKMNELQASMGICIMNDINMIKHKRKNIYEIYHKYLPENYIIPYHDPNNFNYGNFPIIFNSEKDLLRAQEIFEQYNIIAERYLYSSLINPDDFVKKETPNAYHYAKRILCLPISEDMTEYDILKIINLLKQYSS